MEFGEGILFKKKRVNQAKNLSVWEDGIYLGIRGMSGEIIVGTKAGVWKTRTVQRKPKEYRWCPTNEKLVGGVPWKTEAEDEEQEEKGPDKVMRPEMKRMGEKEEEETKARIEVPRSFTITRADLERHGFTSKCLGCKALIRRTTRQHHSQECRERMKAEMTNEAKVKDAKKRAEILRGCAQRHAEKT